MLSYFPPIRSNLVHLMDILVLSSLDQKKFSEGGGLSLANPKQSLSLKDDRRQEIVALFNKTSGIWSGMPGSMCGTFIGKKPCLVFLLTFSAIDLTLPYCEPIAISRDTFNTFSI